MLGSIALLVGYLELASAVGSYNFTALAEASATQALPEAIGQRLAWFDLPVKWLITLLFALTFGGLAVKVGMGTRAWLVTRHLRKGPHSSDHGPHRPDVQDGARRHGEDGDPSAPLCAFQRVTSNLGDSGFRPGLRRPCRDGADLIQTSFGIFIDQSPRLLLDRTAGPWPTEHGRTFHANCQDLCPGGAPVANVLPWAHCRRFVLPHASWRKPSSKNPARRWAWRIACDHAQICGLDGPGRFASIGLPGLSGFIGEFLIFRGVFALSPWVAIGSLPALLITAIFLLRFLQHVFHGKSDPESEQFSDLSGSEMALMAPLFILIVLLGWFPHLIMERINPTIILTIERMIF